MERWNGDLGCEVMTKAGEARRWTLKRFPPMAGSGRETRVRGDVLKDGEEVRVREDKACGEDVEKVRAFLRAHFYPLPVNQELPVTTEMQLRQNAYALLAAVFGGPDDNE